MVCDQCGFSYLNPRWTPARYSKFYEEEYDELYRPEIISSDDEKHRYIPIKQIVERLRTEGRLTGFTHVLDLGSGMGHAMTYLRDHLCPSATFDAIEPSPECGKHITGNGFNLIATDVYSDWDSGAEASYDLIIMRHVLEHFHDPMAVLRKVRKVLAPNGLLYVAVPDALHPTRPLRGHFFRAVHISYFTRHSLKAMLNACGLSELVIKEGDQLAKHEVFAICRPGSIGSLAVDRKYADEQVALYRKMDRPDLIYSVKSLLIRLAKRLHLIS